MLGSGTYGSVFKGTHKTNKEVRAIKAIAKSKVKNPESFKNEIDIMRKLVCSFYLEQKFHLKFANLSTLITKRTIQTL